MNQRVADLWYGIEPCEPDVVHIRETHIDPYAAGDIWLIRGAERDLVFDTGTGILSLEPLVSMLAGKPTLAVACSHNYDHAGGIHAFANRACHRREARLVTQPPAEYLDTLADAFHALPYDGFDPAAYRQPGAEPTQLLEHGDRIDLGDRSLTVLHIPGHTPGSIALWEEATGSLFGGETLFVDPLARDFPPAHSVQLYENSLKMLGALPVRRVFGGHFGTFGPNRLTKLIEQEIGRYGFA